ncbi:MAG: N-formylglutamate amidohydrolase [Maritimibacter sp.]|nr:N-formylglutamate amidohydrolase [Maritimibacter sp.]
MLHRGAPIEAARTFGPEGRAPVLLLCEHASNHIPAAFGDLGIDPATRESHVAWDPGALELSQRLSAAWGLPLVAGAVSRLVYDCNRPPEAPDAIPARSELHAIPGNRDLSDAARAARVTAVYEPWIAAVEAAIDRAEPQALITLHSFTPVYFGKPRSVQIGILYDRDTQLSDALLAQDWGRFIVRGNEPYGPEDGVTHSLRRHALSRGLPNAMIEVRNDLLADPVGRDSVIRVLSRNIAHALDRFGIVLEGAA